MEVLTLLAAQHLSPCLPSLLTGATAPGGVGPQVWGPTPPHPLTSLAANLPHLLVQHPTLFPRLLQGAVGAVVASTARAACSEMAAGQAVRVQPKVCARRPSFVLCPVYCPVLRRRACRVYRALSVRVCVGKGCL